MERRGWGGGKRKGIRLRLKKSSSFRWMKSFRVDLEKKNDKIFTYSERCLVSANSFVKRCVSFDIRSIVNCICLSRSRRLLRDFFAAKLFLSLFSRYLQNLFFYFCFLQIFIFWKIFRTKFKSYFKKFFYCFIIIYYYYLR